MAGVGPSPAEPAARRGWRLWLAGILLAATSVSAGASPVEFERLYGELLKTYWHAPVRIHGIDTTVFDYARMAQDAQTPDSLYRRILRALERTDPGTLSDPGAAKAFWINAYNFGAMRLVIDHYPVDSIRSLSISLIGYPWAKQALKISDRLYSLKQIEKDVLLKRYGDPRIVFAVSCAAVSCPDRTAEPFAAGRLDTQLDTLIRDLFRNPGKGLRLDRDRRRLTLSPILNMDRRLFEDRPGGVLGFVLPYLDPDLRAWLEANPVTLDYFEHDWTLNDLAQAD